jgi:molecular chaperone GrpE (heat shock protein)
MDAPRADAGDRAVEAKEVEPGTVVREVWRGWRLPDGLLRPAQVVVATGEEPARPWR